MSATIKTPMIRFVAAKHRASPQGSGKRAPPYDKDAKTPQERIETD